MDVGIVAFQVDKPEADALGFVEQAEGTVYAARPAELETIDLHHLQGIDVVLAHSMIWRSIMTAGSVGTFVRVVVDQDQLPG